MASLQRAASAKKAAPALDTANLAPANPFQSGEQEPVANPVANGGVPELQRSASPPRTPAKSRDSATDDGVPRYERLFNLSREIEAKKEARRASLEVSDSPQKFKTIGENTKKNKRPSSAFKSAKPAHDPFPPQKGSPAPGKYDVPSIEAEAMKAAAKGKLSASFTSSTPRLPDPKTEAPGVGVYDVKKSGFDTSKTGIVKSTTPRFEENKTPSPGPGVYEIDPKPMAKVAKSPSAVFKSSIKRTDLPVGSPLENPAPGVYDPDALVKAEQKKRPSSASFVSNLPRFEEPKLETPPAGYYEPKDVRKSPHQPNLKQTSERFKEPAPASPGPGVYEIDPKPMAKVTKSPSAVFKSSIKRTDLPVGSPLENPAPTAYEPEPPKSADKMRVSATYASKSPRLPDPRTDTPPVGAYGVKPGAFDVKKNAMPDYSIRTPERFPDPRASSQGPLSEFKPYTPVRTYAEALSRKGSSVNSPRPMAAIN